MAASSKWSGRRRRPLFFSADSRDHRGHEEKGEAVSMEENTLFLKGKEENCFSSFGIIILSNI
jgi:hypothetical protein